MEGSGPGWQWDEMQQVGTDFADPKEAAAYDEAMATFRDPVAEAERVLERLELGPEDKVIEVGTGTGWFAITAAKTCAHVYAWDVSEAMLGQAGKNASAQGVENVTFSHGGFLAHAHSGPPVDAVVSQFALHHLPDFWKAVAFRRMAQVLKPGGKLFLADVIFSFPLEGYEERLISWISALPPVMQKGAYGHIAKEFSTFDWVIEELMEREGFRIEWKNYPDELISQYMAVRI